MVATSTLLVQRIDCWSRNTRDPKISLEAGLKRMKHPY